MPDDGWAGAPGVVRLPGIARVRGRRVGGAGLAPALLLPYRWPPWLLLCRRLLRVWRLLPVWLLPGWGR